MAKPKWPKDSIRVVVHKGEVFSISDGSRSRPVVNEKGTFYPKVTLAAKAIGVDPSAITYALAHEGARCQKMTWRVATLDECLANGLLAGVKSNKTQAAQALASQTMQVASSAPGSDVNKLYVRSIKTNGNLVMGNDKAKYHTVPVVNSRGEFYPSGLVGAQALGLRDKAVIAAIHAGRVAGGLGWRYATVDDCKAVGVDTSKVMGIKIPPPKKLHAQPSTTTSGVSNTTLDALIAKGRAVEVTKLTGPYKRPAGSVGSGDPAPAFYAIKWPDGTVTFRMNHGSTWTMTRSSQNLTEVPKEILDATVWCTPSF